jgi:sulfate adenylyltransferase
MNSGWSLPDEVLRDAPSYTPRPYELADLELLLTGAYAPLTGFLGHTDLACVSRTGRLADGTRWPVPVTLEVPDDVTGVVRGAGPAGIAEGSYPLWRSLVLTNPEGAPIAAIDIAEQWPVRPGWTGLGGPVRRIGDGGHGPFRSLHRTPDEVRAQLPPGRVLGVIADQPLHRPQLAQIAASARTLAGHLVVLIPTATPTPNGLPPEALVRSVLAAHDRMPEATIVAVPLAPHGDEVYDALLRARVAAAYGITHLFSTGTAIMSGGEPRVLVPRELAYDSRDGQWRGRDDIPPRFRRLALSSRDIDELLDRSAPLPEWHTPPAVARELTRGRPPRRHRGLVLFFTGLSGSGKSTIARAVSDVLLETGERTVTLLDGDVVRRELSAGLSFSKADRDTNIRRVGWVAAEVARHGGLAICCPIAPYAQARATARRLAHEAGAGFILVYVATPVEVCAERDRKGLYARARTGQLAGLTGVDDPYEVPTDADLVLDTSDISVAAATDEVLAHLAKAGWIDRRR